MAECMTVTEMKDRLLKMTPAELKGCVERLRVSIMKAGNDTRSIGIMRNTIEDLRKQSKALGFPLPEVNVEPATPGQEMARLVSENAQLTEQVASLQEVVKRQAETILLHEEVENENQALRDQIRAAKLEPDAVDRQVAAATQDATEVIPVAGASNIKVVRSDSPDDGYVGHEPLDPETPEPQPETTDTQDTGEPEPAVAETGAASAATPGAAEPAPADPTRVPPVPPAVVATRHAIDLAAEHGIDLADVECDRSVAHTGNKITKADVQKHIEQIREVAHA
jgi:hypothetical protein